MDEFPVPALISNTITVPDSVPSVFHNSMPFTPLVAAKKRMPFTLQRADGLELAKPGLISFTISVPAVVPSVFHSSIPFTGSVAVKYTNEPTVTICVGEDEALEKMFISFTNSGTWEKAENEDVIKAIKSKTALFISSILRYRSILSTGRT